VSESLSQRRLGQANLAERIDRTTVSPSHSPLSFRPDNGCSADSQTLLVKKIIRSNEKTVSFSAFADMDARILDRAIKLEKRILDLERAEVER